MFIPDSRNQNVIQLLNETTSFSMTNISNNLGSQLANLTEELNVLKRKQLELIDLGDNHDNLLDYLSIAIFEKYTTYADSIKNENFQELARKYRSMSAIDLGRLATERLQDTLTLKLNPIDDNLNKVFIIER